MSSENEMIEQPDDTEPVIDTQIQQAEPIPEQASTSEPALVPEVEDPIDVPDVPAVQESTESVETAVITDEPLADEQPDDESESVVEESEDGWEAWIGASPEEEIVADVATESDDEPEAATETIENPVTEAANVLDEPEPVATMAEEPVEEAVVPTEVVAEAEIVSGNSQESTEEILAQAVIEAEDKEAAEDDPVESEEPAVEVPVPPTPKPKPQKRKQPRRDGLTAKDVVTYFAPCGRCGYFLSSYRAAYGRENFETAVSEANRGWLTLSWGNDVREIVLKSYGNRIETNDLHFEGCCSECRRVFTYKNSRSDDAASVFQIEIKPGKSQ